jgi:hypothetical protein
MKPRIKLNTHKHAPYRWRCVVGRYNGYADTILDAYIGCVKCFAKSSYWEPDIKRNSELLTIYETALAKGFIK